MANIIQLVTKFSTKAWDKVYKAEALSSILDGDKDLMKFTGAKTVKIAKFNVSGLSDYRRPNGASNGTYGGDGHDTSMAAGSGYGYEQGDAALVWEEFVISCDRAIQLRIDLFDDEETDGLAVAAATTETSRTQVIPEVDAYVFSKLAENAGTSKTQDITPSATLGIGSTGNPIYELNAAFQALADNEVPETDQVIFCSNAFYNAIRSTGEIVKTLRQTEYGDNVKFTIGEYEGRTIVAVPSPRFKTKIKLLRGGYGWDTGSQSINFIVCAKSAVYHVTKYDKVRVFSPNLIQDFDGYKVNVHIYHDVFVPDNKKPAIYVCLANDATLAAGSKKAVRFDNDVASKKVTVKECHVTAGDLCRKFYLTTTAPVIGADVTANTSTELVIDYVDSAKGIVFKQTAALSNGTYYLIGTDNGSITAIGTSLTGQSKTIVIE